MLSKQDGTTPELRSGWRRATRVVLAQRRAGGSSSAAYRRPPIATWRVGGVGGVGVWVGGGGPCGRRTTGPRRGVGRGEHSVRGAAVRRGLTVRPRYGCWIFGRGNPTRSNRRALCNRVGQGQPAACHLRSVGVGSRRAYALRWIRSVLGRSLGGSESEGGLDRTVLTLAVDQVDQELGSFEALFAIFSSFGARPPRRATQPAAVRREEQKVITGYPPLFAHRTNGPRRPRCGCGERSGGGRGFALCSGAAGTGLRQPCCRPVSRMPFRGPVMKQSIARSRPEHGARGQPDGPPAPPARPPRSAEPRPVDPPTSDDPRTARR